MGVIHDGYGRAIDENNPLNVRVSGIESGSVQPFDHQATLTNTAVTHTGVVVAPSGSNTQSTWQPVPEGMTEFATNIVQDIGNAAVIQRVYWSEDGTSNSGRTEPTIPATSFTEKTSTQWYPVGGAFYKAGVYNGHTAPVTCSTNIKFRP